MSLIPTKAGADRKKLIALGVLVAVAVIVYLLNRESGDSGGPTHPSTVAVGAGPKTMARPAGRPGARGAKGGLGNAREYRPSMKPPKDVDPSATDPTLHLPALVKLRDVKLEGGGRSLFEILAAPPPDVKLAVVEPANIKPAFVAQGPKPPPPPAPPPPTPNAPPIPLKFFGFVNPLRPDVKHAFFMENDEIIVAGEGDVIKKHYKIIRIGVNSAEVEDIQFKGNNTKQTLPLETEMQG